MTDDQQWQAPGSALPPPATPIVREQQPVAPPMAFAQTAPPSGWTPPPKPGLIPLRPMTLGTILGAAFQTVRRSPSILIPALVLTLAIGLVQVLASAGFITQYFGAAADLGGTNTSVDESITSLTSGALGLAATSVGTGILGLVATAIVHALVTLQVASTTLGARLRLGALWRRTSGRRGAILGWAALTGLVGLLALVIVGGLLVAVGSTGSAGVVVAVLLGLLLGAALVVVFVWLWVKLGFVPAAIVLERATIRASIARSWSLTRGAFWRLFGIRLLVGAMIYVATQIVATPIAFAFSLGTGVLSPNGTTAGSAAQDGFVSTVVTLGATSIISAVGLVVATATTALLYLDQRMRLEGLDLDLARYVERRQSGERELGDPYRTPGSA